MTEPTTLKEWLETIADEAVRKLAAEFPPGKRFDIAGTIYYVIGWTEDDGIVISPVDPSKDYAGATADKHVIHAAHARPPKP